MTLDDLAAASRGNPCDSMAFLLYPLPLLTTTDNHHHHNPLLLLLVATSLKRLKAPSFQIRIVIKLQAGLFFK